MRVDEIMTKPVVSIGPEEPASVAWPRMEREHIRHLVVLDHGWLVGVVSQRDLGGRGGAAVRRNRTVGELMAKHIASAKPGMTLH
jgi:CBS domain-containing protein